MNKNYILITMLLTISLFGCESTKPSKMTTADTKQETTTENQAVKETGDSSHTVDKGLPASNVSHNEEKVVFPKLVQEGMNVFVSKTKLPPLLAPTFIPTPKSEPKTLTVKAWDLGPKNPSYHVEFLQNTSNKNFVPIAGFSGTIYESNEDLNNAFLGVSALGDPTKLENGMTGKMITGRIDFGDGIAAKTYQYNTDRESAKHINHYGNIIWQEGRWTIEVINTGVDTLPVDVAKEVVSYLHSNRLPGPDSEGAVVITIQPTINPPVTNSFVTWDKGKVLYQTTSYEGTSSLSALEMAVSMHQYP